MSKTKEKGVAIVQARSDETLNKDCSGMGVKGGSEAVDVV